MADISVLISGGTPESQREFLETLAADPSDPRLGSQRNKGRVPPIANQFALGYTYQDVLDADQEGTVSLFSTAGSTVIFRDLAICRLEVKG